TVRSFHLPGRRTRQRRTTVRLAPLRIANIRHRQADALFPRHFDRQQAEGGRRKAEGGRRNPTGQERRGPGPWWIPPSPLRLPSPGLVPILQQESCLPL